MPPPRTLNRVAASLAGDPNSTAIDELMSGTFDSEPPGAATNAKANNTGAHVTAASEPHARE